VNTTCALNARQATSGTTNSSDADLATHQRMDLSIAQIAQQKRDVSNAMTIGSLTTFRMDASRQSQTVMFLHIISTEMMELSTYASSVLRGTSLKKDTAQGARSLDASNV
jgi:hypothetical protein